MEPIFQIVQEREIYLEVKTNGRFIPLLVTLQRSDRDFSTHHEFHISLKLLNAPHYCINFWFILGFARTCRVDFYICCIWRDRNLSYDIRCEICSFKDCFYFNTVLKFVEFWIFLDNRDNLEGQVDIF